MASPKSSRVHYTAVQGVELDALIKEMSDHIGLEWNFLARSLDFTETDIEAIVYANERNLREQIYQFFYKWRRREGDNATPDILIPAAEDASLFELLKTLESKGLVTKRRELPSFDDTPPPTPPSVSTPPLMPTPPSIPTPPSMPTPPSRLDTDVDPDSTVKDSPHNLRSPQTSGGDQRENEREFVRRKRLENLARNISNQSFSSDVSNKSSEDMQRQPSTSSVPDTPPVVSPSCPQPVCPFELDDVVMVERVDAAPWYGVVKWIGDLPENPGVPVAGIEMEMEVAGGGDGTKDGERFFQCDDRHGLFLRVSMLKRDNRFDVSPDSPSPSPTPFDNALQPRRESDAPSGEASNQSASATSGLQTIDDMLKRLGLVDPISNASGNSNSESSDTGTKVLMFTIPVDHAGLVIGREGRNIQEVERLTNTSIKMERGYGQMMSGNKRGIIYGSEENQKKALQMILNRLKRRVSQQTAKAETIEIPEDKVGLVIGKGGQTVNAIKSLSGVVDIKIEDRPVGLASFSLFSPSSRKCVITGSEEDIEKAKQLIGLAIIGGNIVVGATLAALIADLASLGVEVEESNNS